MAINNVSAQYNGGLLVGIILLTQCYYDHVVVVAVSHIQRIGCQHEKTTLHGGGQSCSWSAE